MTFHLPGDKLTFTTAEHTIPTQIDPTQGTNTKP